VDDRLRDLRVPEPLVHARAAMTVLALLLGGYGLALPSRSARASWPSTSRPCWRAPRSY
jgi:hypothetical protein